MELRSEADRYRALPTLPFLFWERGERAQKNWHELHHMNQDLGPELMEKETWHIYA